MTIMMAINGDDTVRADDAGRFVGRCQFPAYENHPFYEASFFFAKISSSTQQTHSRKQSQKRRVSASFYSCIPHL